MYLFLLVVSAVVFGVVVLAYVRSGFASIFHPITLYLMFHGLVFVVRPFFAYFDDYHQLYQAYHYHPSVATKSIVIVAVNLGLLAFVIGAWRTGGIRLTFKQSAAQLRHRERLMKPFALVLALLAPLASASLLGLLSPASADMRLDVSTGVVYNTSGNGWFGDSQLLLVPICVMVAWVFRFRWWSLAPLLAFILLRAQGGGRGPFVVACVAAAMLWLFDRKLRVPSPRMFAAFAALLVLFVVVGQDRGTSVRTFLQEGRVVRVETKGSVIASMDFANMEFMEYLVETIPAKTGGYGWFLDNLQVFTEPIPRVWWPDKPRGPPIKLYNLFDYGFPIGMTYSLPGEGWAQAGFFGVIVWCALWGLVLGAIYARFARGRQSNFDVALYFCFLPLFVIAFRDGTLLTVARTAVFYLAPPLAWIAAARFLGVREPGTAASARRVQAPPAPSDLRSPPQRLGRDQAKAEIVPRAWRRRLGRSPAA